MTDNIKKPATGKDTLERLLDACTAALRQERDAVHENYLTCLDQRNAAIDRAARAEASLSEMRRALNWALLIVGGLPDRGSAVTEEYMKYQALLTEEKPPRKEDFLCDMLDCTELHCGVCRQPLNEKNDHSTCGRGGRE